ncbi:hypothetical protein Tco_1452168 [Tanacetum coccineum]
MQKSHSILTYDKHNDFYNALINSISLDEAIAKGNLDPAKVLRKIHHNDDHDPLKDSAKEKKKRRRTDTKPSTKSSTSKESSKGKTPPKASKANKSVNAEETIEEHIIEMAMDVEEPILDDVQPPRPETPDLEWNKDPNVNDGLEQTWFNDLVNAKKALLTFDDLMANPIDFTKFAMNRLKKDKITKADLVGHVYKLLKGTCRSCIELEYNMEQCYLALSNQLDWTTLEGDKCPYDLSKPLPLQGPLGHLTIYVDFFFNNDLEYL